MSISSTFNKINVRTLLTTGSISPADQDFDQLRELFENKAVAARKSEF
jgi:hypothetical protein